MEAYSPSEQQTAESKKAAHLGRIAERIDHISKLQALLIEEDKNTLIAALRVSGYSKVGDGFEEKSLQDIRLAIQVGIDQMEAENNQVPGLAAAVNKGLVDAAKPTTEVINENPLLAAFQEQYEALSEADRTYNGKIKNWEEVRAAIPDMADFLVGVESLEQAQIYFLNEEGQLAIGNGCAEPPDQTLNYHQSRYNATRISYIDSNGKVVIVDGDDTEIPSEAQVLSVRGLLTIEEYKRVNRGQFEKPRDFVTWIESGENPSAVRAACWRNNRVNWSHRYGPGSMVDGRGSRRVLRVNLNFES